MNHSNETISLVNDYLVRKSLSEIGCSFNYDDLSQFEVEYLTFIQSEMARHKHEAEKRAARKSARKR